MFLLAVRAAQPALRGTEIAHRVAEQNRQVALFVEPTECGQQLKQLLWCQGQIRAMGLIAHRFAKLYAKTLGAEFSRVLMQLVELRQVPSIDRHHHVYPKPSHAKRLNRSRCATKCATGAQCIMGALEPVEAHGDIGEPRSARLLGKQITVELAIRDKIHGNAAIDRIACELRPITAQCWLTAGQRDELIAKLRQFINDPAALHRRQFIAARPARH